MSKKLNTEKFIARAKKIHGYKFDYSKSKYVDAKTKIVIRCKKHNYLFEQTSNGHYNSKYPCEYCLKDAKRDSFSDSLSTFANKVRAIYGDKFLFDEAIYINQREPITLICSIHRKRINKPPQVFLKGHGCDLCKKEELAIEHSKQKLDEIKSYIKVLGGKCLSNKYIDNEAKLNFECKVGHKFKRSWSSVKNMLRWCPECSPNKLIGESLARLILEHLLKMKFPSTFIEELEGLQLDGYNSENNIAFEYQGYQHFDEESHYHSNNHQFKEQLKRDKLKKELCKKHNITLIEIFEFQTIRSGRIQKFVVEVKETLDQLGIKYSNDPFELDLVYLYRGRENSQYTEAKKIVEKNKGKIEGFIGAASKHKYICEKGHIVKNRTLSVIIKSNASCPTCNSEKRFKKLKKIIESRGGELLEVKMKPRGLTEVYQWKCSNNHLNKSKGQFLYSGSWCKKCQRESQRIKLNSIELKNLEKDLKSGDYYQKDLIKKYKISDGVFRRIIKEENFKTNYKFQDHRIQRKRTKGRLFQINPHNYKVVNIYESLESVKHDKNNKFKPEGIRKQMKLYRKAYGFYWCREQDLDETIDKIKIGKSRLF